MDAQPTESDELAVLTAMRSGRAQFFRAVTETAESHAPAKRRDAKGTLLREYVALLRSDGAAQIAEFLFLLEELDLKDGARIRDFLEAHNVAMQGYLDDPARMRALGVTPQRIEAAMFSEEQMQFVALVSPPGSLYLDQSALGRLLSEAMAPESCRKIAVALAEGGLLRRHQVGHVLLSSDGQLEGLYRTYLGGVVEKIRGRP